MKLVVLCWYLICSFVNGNHHSMDGCCKQKQICDTFNTLSGCQSLSSICYWDNNCDCDECCINTLPQSETTFDCQQHSSNSAACNKNNPQCEWICDGSIPDELVPAPTVSEPLQCCHYNTECTSERIVACDDLTPDDCLTFPEQCYMSCIGPQSSRNPIFKTKRTWIGKTEFTAEFDPDNESEGRDAAGSDPTTDSTVTEIMDYETYLFVDILSGGHVFQYNYDYAANEFERVLRSLEDGPFTSSVRRMFTANDNNGSEPTPGPDDGLQLHRRLFGNDDRWRVIASATKWPYRATGLIGYSGQHSGIGCTGTLIGPKHVLTAGHCVHTGGEDGDWINKNSMRFYPRTISKSECESRVGYGVSGYWSVTGWVNDEIRKYDYAMLILSGTPNYAMGFGWKKPIPLGWWYHSNGYPAETKSGAEMWHTHCKFTNWYTRSFRSKVCDFEKGTSGSGLYHWLGQHPINYAIHVARTASKNYEVRITKTRFNLFCDWIDTDWVC